MRRYVAVDLETTGVDTQKDYIVEVGLAGEKYDGSYFEECFSLDFPKAAMTMGAAAVNGWGRRQFAPIVTHSWAVGFLQEALRNVYIVGKVPSFDAAFLERLFRESINHIAPVWHHRLTDVGSLAWGWDTKGAVSYADLPPNTEMVEEMVGIRREKVDGYHNALCDARWDYKVFRHIIPKGD